MRFPNRTGHRYGITELNSEISSNRTYRAWGSKIGRKNRKLNSPGIGMGLCGSALTLNSGFDAKANHKMIREQGLTPVIYPNRRNAKEPIVIAHIFRWFNKEIYKDHIKSSELSGGNQILIESSP